KWLNVARLYNAAKRGDAAVLRRLIEECVPFDHRNVHGVTPLWHAAHPGHIEVVKALLATNAVDVNVRSIAGRTPIFWASANGHAEIVELLLR
ncbi:ankyrin, partial [Polyplosphaeria fusca]